MAGKRLVRWLGRRVGLTTWQYAQRADKPHEVACNCLGDGWVHGGLGTRRVACSHCPAGDRWHAENVDARWCCPSYKEAS